MPVIRAHDIVGMTFNYWTVLERHGKRGQKATWKCICKCGKIKVIAGQSIRSGESKSCGCRPHHTTGHRHTINYSATPTYRSWQSMVSRCTQPSSPAFTYYNKRGIKICKQWRTFANFFADMGERPDGTTLDRYPNNGGNYEPGNCRWATQREQANNKITNLSFTFDGKQFTLAELARHTGASKEKLRSRLCRSKLPWTVEGAVKTPVLPKTMTKAGFYC